MIRRKHWALLGQENGAVLPDPARHQKILALTIVTLCPNKCILSASSLVVTLVITGFLRRLLRTQDT